MPSLWKCHTPRPHPLGTGDSVLRSVRRERRQLAPIRALAGHTVNTAKFNVHELREMISEKFRGDREQSRIMVHVISFGYRYGVPLDSGLVFDVRFLPNPNYIPEFKKLSGRHRSVMIAGEMRKRLAAHGFRVKATHRDIEKP